MGVLGFGMFERMGRNVAHDESDGVCLRALELWEDISRGWIVPVGGSTPDRLRTDRLRIDRLRTDWLRIGWLRIGSVNREKNCGANC